MKNKIYIMGILLLLFLSLEVFARIRGIKPIHPDCRIASETYYYILTANSTCRSKTTEWDVSYSVNSQNLREYEYPLTKTPDSYRILLLGDSFVEGYGQPKENSFPKLLESRLRESSSPKTDVIAAGVSAWGTISEYFYLLKQGLNYDPDLVILVFHISDFSDNFLAASNLSSEGKKLLLAPALSLNEEFISQNNSLFITPLDNPPPDTGLLTSMKIFLDNNSTIYNSTRLYLKNIFPDQKDFLAGDPAKDVFAVSRIPQPENYQHLMTQTQDVIKNMHSLLIGKGVDFMIVLVPSGHTVNTNEWDRGRTVWGYQKDTIYPNPVYEELIQWGEDQGIKSYNLTSSLQAASHSQKLYYSYDGHFNKQGNQVVADTLFNILSKTMTTPP